MTKRDNKVVRMKKYEEPIMEVITMDIRDVITLSVNTGDPTKPYSTDF